MIRRMIFKPRRRIAFLPFLIVVAVSLISSAEGKNPNPKILPANSAPHGKTYGEWSAAWFKWAYEQPAATNPEIDQTGANCGAGQPDHVWFLAGTFFPAGAPATGPVVRTCTIPAGRMLFFPIGNGFCAGDDFPNGFADEQACATQIAEGLSGFRAEIDGVPVSDLGADVAHSYYRALSPDFSLVLSADNIFGAPAGTYSPGAGDGIYLMLAPLSPGEHVIHFHADTADGGQVDATYYLTVTAGAS